MTRHEGGTVAAIARIPANLSRHDLTPVGAIASSVVTLSVIAALDLIDGHIGWPFAVGYLLVVTTAPVAVQPRGLYALLLMPPVLLFFSMLVLAALAPDAIAIENLPASTGVFGHSISATVHHGSVLLMGQALAITGVMLRIWVAQNPRGYRYFSQG